MKHRITASLLSLCIFCLFSTSSLGQLPPDFFEEKLDASFNLPVGIHFDEKGRGYVWEKGGRVFILDSLDNPLPQPFIDLSEEVGEWRDHGMLGFTLHPNFYQNGYVYLMYTVDRHHLLNYGTTDYYPDSTIVEQATIGRIVRYTAEIATGFTTVDENSRLVLLGKDMSDGIPITANFHGVGALAFGEDGTLLVSSGDGGIDIDPAHPNETYHAFQALDDGIIRDAEFIGPFRSQLVNNLNGKILRIDPETGAGVTGNPWFDSEDPNAPASRVFSLGYRNPYRFIVIPETGAHFPEEADPGTMLIGDVGEGKWEELNKVEEPGINAGWPIFEGLVKNYNWSNDLRDNMDAANPLGGQNGCDREYFRFQDLIVQEQLNPVSFPNPCDPFQEVPVDIPVFEHSRPLLSWSHSLWNLPERTFYPEFDDAGKAIEIDVTSQDSDIETTGFGGFSSIPGFWYEEGGLPSQYHKSCFVADFSGWIKIFRMNDQHDLIGVDSFRNDIKGIVALGFNPVKEALYWLNIYNGSLYRISYGGNPPPMAHIETDTLYGSSPLTVRLNATGSTDANGPIESYFWDFGDGENSVDPVVSHTFESPNDQPFSYEVTLTVTDTSGASHTARVSISLNNSPPQVRISSVSDGDFYPVSDFTHLKLEAAVSDVEHRAGELTYHWQTFLHHNAHFHPEPIDTNRSTFTTIDPLGCGEETYWFRIKLTVTDAAGLSTSDELEVFPWCGDFYTVVDPFTGTAMEDHIRLGWETSMADDIGTYVIQKLGNKARILDYGFVDANMVNVYTFDDTNPTIGRNEYRLKLLRADGVFDYSDWVVVEYPPLTDLRIFPNPAPRSSTSLRFAKAQDAALHISIYTAHGKLVRNLSFPVTSGEETLLEMNTSSLNPGIYILDIKNGEESFRRQIVVY